MDRYFNGFLWVYETRKEENNVFLLRRNTAHHNTFGNSQSWQTVRYGSTLAVFAASADAGIEREVVGDHRNPREHVGSVANKRCAFHWPRHLALFDLDRAWQIAEEDFRSKSKNSPFDGRTVRGRAVKTVVGGRVVFQTGD